MAAARYWRIVGIETYSGGDLELSELRLCGAAGWLDIGIVPTSSHAPIEGALANLNDAETATTCRFDGRHLRSAGFFIAWDLGAAKEGLYLRPGSASAVGRYLQSATLQYFESGAWKTLSNLGRFMWPGADSMDTSESAGDANYSNVALLLHMDGVDGSKVFTDTSPSPKGQTVAASGVAITTARSAFGGASAQFTGGYIWFGSSGDAALAPGSQDFCIEGWCYDMGGGNRRILFGNAGSNGGGGTILLLLSESNNFSVGLTADGVRYTINPSTPTPLNTWYHIALVRFGTTVKLFLNGTAIGSVEGVTGSVQAGSGPFSLGSQGLYLGYGGGYGVQWMGAVDEFRYTIGAARYTANFTRPAAPFIESSGLGVVLGPYTAALSKFKQNFVAASAPVPLHSTHGAPHLQMARDVEVGGPGTIYGTTKTKGTPNVPTKARVVLLHQRSKQPVRETWSDPVTGAFAFTSIDVNQQFLTLAEDAADNFLPVAANKLTPEVIG